MRDRDGLEMGIMGENPAADNLAIGENPAADNLADENLAENNAKAQNDAAATAAALEQLKLEAYEYWVLKNAGNAGHANSFNTNATEIANAVKKAQNNPNDLVKVEIDGFGLTAVREGLEVVNIVFSSINGVHSVSCVLPPIPGPSSSPEEKATFHARLVGAFLPIRFADPNIKILCINHLSPKLLQKGNFEDYLIYLHAAACTEVSKGGAGFESIELSDELIKALKLTRNAEEMNAIQEKLNPKKAATGDDNRIKVEAGKPSNPVSPSAPTPEPADPLSPSTATTSRSASPGNSGGASPGGRNSRSSFASSASVFASLGQPALNTPMSDDDLESKHSSINSTSEVEYAAAQEKYAAARSSAMGSLYLSPDASRQGDDSGAADNEPMVIEKDNALDVEVGDDADNAAGQREEAEPDVARIVEEEVSDARFPANLPEEGNEEAIAVFRCEIAAVIPESSGPSATTISINTASLPGNILNILESQENLTEYLTHICEVAKDKDYAEVEIIIGTDNLSEEALQDHAMLSRYRNYVEEAASDVTKGCACTTKLDGDFTQKLDDATPRSRTPS